MDKILEQVLESSSLAQDDRDPSSLYIYCSLSPYLNFKPITTGKLSVSALTHLILF